MKSDMEVKRRGDTFTFKAGVRREVNFWFFLNDFSTFGNPDKKPLYVRENYLKCNRILRRNDINQLVLIMESGEYFKIKSPTYTRKRTEKDCEEYYKLSKSRKNKLNVEPSKLEVTIIIPEGSAVEILSVSGAYHGYIVNDGGTFKLTKNIDYVEDVSGVCF